MNTSSTNPTTPIADPTATPCPQGAASGWAKSACPDHRLPWDEEIWNRINAAVHAECKRTKVAAQFLPPYGPLPDALTVPSDTPLIEEETGTLNIDEAATVQLLEVWTEFTLTPQQVAREKDLRTAYTLATRASNFLSQAVDLFIFQGDHAHHNPLIKHGLVKFRSGPAGDGLLPLHLPHEQIIPVPPLHHEHPPRWGERAFEAVAEGYARLQNKGHYGPYALALHTIPYADTYAPLATTLIMPADRIKPLMTAGFYGSGTLPELVSTHGTIFTGALVSLGGNTVDLVVGRAAAVSFLLQDPEGKYRFRVWERFALRLKDETAVIRLDFHTEPIPEAEPFPAKTVTAKTVTAKTVTAKTATKSK